MRDLRELIDPSGRGRAFLDERIARSVRPVEILGCGPDEGDRELASLGITTRSPLGAIAHRTGGLLVDGGWIRVLGAGCPRLPRSISSWNARARLDGATLVADDAIGGLFALDGGRFGGPVGGLHYYAPDALAWEPLQMGYSDWLAWLCEGDLDRFYEGSRWDGWRDEVRALEGDRAFLVYPFPFAAGPPFASRARRAVPIDELFALYVEDLPQQLGRR